MIGSIARVFVGTLIPIILIDVLFIASFIISTNRWAAWEEVVGSIVGFSMIFMFIPALIIAVVAEIVLGAGIGLRLFLALGAAAGLVFGMGVVAVSGYQVIALVLWPTLGVAGGLLGAYCMSRMHGQMTVNNKLQPTADAPAE